MNSEPTGYFCEEVELEPHENEKLKDLGDSTWCIHSSPFHEHGTHLYTDPLAHLTPTVKTYNPYDDLRSLNEPFVEYIREQPPGVSLDVAGGKGAAATGDLLQLGLITRGVVTNYGELGFLGGWIDPRISHVGGNLLDASTWIEIEKQKDTYCPEGFSLILHRPLIALQNLPRSYYMGAIHTLIDWTVEGGALLMQVPNPMWEDASAKLSIERRSDVNEVVVNVFGSQILITKQ